MEKKILVYGAGAVGLGITTCLMGNGVIPHIVVRTIQKEEILREGVYKKGIFGEKHYTIEEENLITNIVDSEKAYDYILICVKSTDSDEVARTIFEKIGRCENTNFILFQNGWGNSEIFSKYFDKNNIYNGRVITGFSRPKSNTVTITVHSDDIKIGSLYHNNLSNLDYIVKNINKNGIPCSISNDISKDIWAKLLYNSALNPLGAIFKVNYGELIKSRYTKEIIDNIISEIFNVMEKAGYKTNWNNDKEYLNDFYSKIVPPTYEHESSMLQDIRANKKTEIDFLNGAIVKLAKNLDVDVRTNETIVNMIKFIKG